MELKNCKIHANLLTTQESIRNWPSTTAAYASFEWRVQHWFQSSLHRKLAQLSLRVLVQYHVSLPQSPLWQIWTSPGLILGIREYHERVLRENVLYIPIWKLGDSTAALNMSNGILENTWSKISRPFSGVVGVPSEGVACISRILGRVTTKKWKTSSRSLCT